jgi:hypothetical protein
VLGSFIAETPSVYSDKIYETRYPHVVITEVCSVRHLDKRAGVDNITKNHSELLGVSTLSIVRYSKKKIKTQRFGNWICFRPQVSGDTCFVGFPKKS